MSNRILATVTGYENAVKEMQAYVRCFNDGNGENRMVLTESGLEAWDDEGSGEFYKAVCLNINEAEDCASEIYQIQSCW